jgi:serine/threonine-protein kinase HipA
MALLGKNRHYEMQRIQRRHFNSTAKKVGFGADAEPVIQDILARTPEVIANVQRALPPGFSGQVAQTVLAGLQQAARSLEAMPAW